MVKAHNSRCAPPFMQESMRPVNIRLLSVLLCERVVELMIAILGCTLQG